MKKILWLIFCALGASLATSQIIAMIQVAYQNYDTVLTPHQRTDLYLFKWLLTMLGTAVFFVGKHQYDNYSWINRVIRWKDYPNETVFIDKKRGTKWMIWNGILYCGNIPKRNHSEILGKAKNWQIIPPTAI